VTRDTSINTTKLVISTFTHHDVVYLTQVRAP